MTALEEMLIYTKQLHELFMNEPMSDDREQFIEKIHDLLDKRAHVLPKLQQPSTEEEQKQTDELLQVNKFVQKEMDNFFNRLKKEMQTNKLQRKSNRSYTNPYKDVQVADGMFVDRKN